MIKLVVDSRNLTQVEQKLEQNQLAYEKGEMTPIYSLGIGLQEVLVDTKDFTKEELTQLVA